MDKKVLNIIIALVMGAAAVGIYIWSSQQQAPVSGDLGDVVAVIVARKDIARGQRISQADLGLRRIPRTAVEPTSFTSPESVIGKRVLINISRGEQITDNKVASAESITSLAGQVPVGKRAMTIPIDKFSSFEGMIRPGDYVDLIGLFKLPQQMGDQIVTQNVVVPLFQNVQVLAVGASLHKHDEVVQADTVTLALDPQESELLSFALEQGQIRLSLRYPMDDQRVNLPPVSVDTLWQIVLQSLGTPQTPPPEPMPQVVPKEPKEPTIEIYRGGVQ